ncbi:hypothetical protein BV25DRAFT_1921557 [Artomyces pyxidatus]|uniref:Uncharacterized protein n=1 Tax=Artomyces pyxidatus TaxID=48021 RepID=A0ACB8SGV5_9AGAM|nr:hypothetical protein BV25DRAFT_1921557 [Artomyces pyxidatus]
MSEAFFQNSYYIANSFGCILYGAEIVLYAMTMHKLLSPKARKTRQERFFILFSTVVLVLITIALSTQVVFGEEMWIVHADFPRGQGAYLAQFASVWYQTMGTAASFALNCLTSGFLIYRCFVMWSDVRAVVVPGLLWITALALGIVQLWASGAPQGNFFAGLAAKVEVASNATSIALSVLGTSLIVGRILYFARQSKKLLGAETQSMQTYYGATAIVVESMLPNALADIAAVISFGMNSEVSIVFSTISGVLGCVGPQMLMLRVVQGRAWRRNQFSDAMTSIAFASRAPPRASLHLDSSASRCDGGDLRVDLESKRDLSADDAGSSAISADNDRAG